MTGPASFSVITSSAEASDAVTILHSLTVGGRVQPRGVSFCRRLNGLPRFPGPFDATRQTVRQRLAGLAG